jgi:response regulator NasT
MRDVNPAPATRVLLVDESPERAKILEAGLLDAGYRPVGTIASPMALLRAVEQLKPDVIIIDTESPVRDVLEHVVMAMRGQPRPIVMFSNDGSDDAIREAIGAGVAAYVVEGLEPARVKSIIDVAVARFDEHQRLVQELARAQEQLSDRQVIEQAKGILMKTRGLSEAGAYHALRKTAMERGQRVGEVARQLIDIAPLLS